MKLKLVRFALITTLFISTFIFSSIVKATPYCREFTQKINVENKIQIAYGTACMQPDGSWEIVKPAVLPGAPSLPNYAEQPPVYTAPPPAVTYVAPAPSVTYLAPQPYYYDPLFVGVGVGGYYGGGGYHHHYWH